MPQAYRSFREQALHYFVREHEAVRRTPLEGPAAWKGADVARRDDWIVRLDADDVAELERAALSVRARGLAVGGFDREHFALPRLASAVEGWARELDEGRGFLLVRGLPVARWGEELASVVFWGVGLHLGIPGGQNPQEELLGHVTDMGEEATNPFVRRYRTAGDIAYHCDLADVVGLLCLRAAPSGGESRIVSSVSVYNELLRRRPDLVERLYEPFLLDSRDEHGDGPPYFPVPPCRYANGRLRTFYHSDYFRSVVRHADVPPFSESERALMDLYEEIARTAALYLDMRFEPGDVQLISNHTILHARTAYADDGADPSRKRHLLRLWLSLRRA